MYYVHVHNTFCVQSILTTIMYISSFLLALDTCTSTMYIDTIVSKYIVLFGANLEGMAERRVQG